jgi:hypothetical protein
MAKKQTADEELESMLEAQNPDAPSTNGKDVDFEDGEVTTENSEFTFDFSQIGEIKPGWYAAQVQEFLPGVSNAGNPKYDLKMFMPEVSRTLDTQLSLTPAAAWKTGPILRVLGVNAPDMADAQGRKMARFKRSDILGTVCRVQIALESYTPPGGQTRDVPKIVGWEPADKAALALFAEL